MRKVLWVGVLAFLAPLCRADLIGTTVTGVLNFDGLSENFYDPANGFVPTTGFQNSATAQDSATVTIVGGNEFGFDDGVNLDVLSFSATGFTFTDTVEAAGGNTNVTLMLTDPGFTSLSQISNTFPGLTSSIAGDLITITIPGINSVSAGEVFAASFTAAPTTATPEPSSVGILAGLLGVIGLAAMRRRQAISVV